jgi:hypothetical protein
MSNKRVKREEEEQERVAENARTYDWMALGAE